MNIENLKFGNAAGTVKTLVEVEKACKSSMTEITVGSITVKEIKGNTPDSGTGRTYYYHPSEGWSLNSLGLPNMGLTEYCRVLPEMVLMAHSAGKDLRASVAGFSPDDYALLTEECFGLGVDEVELNLGCPNVWGKEGQKPIASYHPELAASILQAVNERDPVSARRIAVKISPVEEIRVLHRLLDVVMDSGFVTRIVGTNTIPNQDRLAEDRSPALSFNNGNHLGGLAGSAIFENALRVMELVWQYTEARIELTSVGGISSGATAHQHLRRTSGFQCATAYWERGPRLFSEILEELSELT